MATYTKQPIVPLETPRLWLRPLTEADAPRIQLLFPHWTIVKYLAAAIPWPYPADGAATFVAESVARMMKQEEYLWSIVSKESESEGLMGLIVLTPASDEDSRGFWIGEKFWRQGYVKEACAAVTDFAFGPLAMSEMHLTNAQPNIASHRLKEAAGAEVISIEEREFVGGRFPSVQWRLTAEAWALHRRAS